MWFLPTFSLVLFFEIYSTTGPSTTLLAFYMAIATNLYSVYIFIKPNLSTKFSEFNFGVPGTTTPSQTKRNWFIESYWNNQIIHFYPFITIPSNLKIYTVTSCTRSFCNWVIGWIPLIDTSTLLNWPCPYGFSDEATVSTSCSNLKNNSNFNLPICIGCTIWGFFKAFRNSSITIDNSLRKSTKIFSNAFV